MMRSISTKLILAFLSIGVISVGVIFIAARWNTRQEFLRFLSDQTQSRIVTSLTQYYEQNGSWDGIDFIYLQTDNLPPQNQGAGPGGPNRIIPFTLTDKNGVVIIASDKYKVGDTVPKSELNLGIPIEDDNTVIGILVPSRSPYQGNQRELEFIDRTNVTLLYSAVIGAVVALLLGIFLSRTITRPIRELTHATHAVSQGDLSQQVPVRTKDELGNLATAFNTMSAELSRSVNTRKQMTADIAHELRTPLSLILGHAEAVHDGVLPPTKENFEIIRDEATRLEHLVDDLRTLSLADAGELSIKLQTIEPAGLLQEVASLYQFHTQNKNIKLELDIAPHLPPLEIDPGRITQVLTNILDNATRYTPEGGTITLSAKQTGRDVAIAVQDSGPGLSKEDVERIFERFYRVDPSRQREDGGSGLGLAIAKSIVQAHNGQLSAESEPGKGLKVIIKLPHKS